MSCDSPSPLNGSVDYLLVSQERSNRLKRNSGALCEQEKQLSPEVGCSRECGSGFPVSIDAVVRICTESGFIVKAGAMLLCERSSYHSGVRCTEPVAIGEYTRQCVGTRHVFTHGSMGQRNDITPRLLDIYPCFRLYPIGCLPKNT